MGTPELSGQEIGVIADALAVLHILTAAFENVVCLVPELLGNDSWDDLAGLIFEHHPFLRREEFLLFGEHIHHLDLVAYIISLVFRIGNHIGHGRVGNLVAVEVSIAFFPEQRLDLLHGVLVGGVEFKQLSDHGGLGLVDDQPFLILSVAKNPTVAQNHILLDGLLMPELHTGGQLAKLVLRDGGHDRQAKLGVFIQRIDIVVLEKDADTIAQKLPGVLDGVQCVSGKTGDLLSDHKVEAILCGFLHHAVEVFPLLCGDTGKALVDVAGHKGPCPIFADQIFVVPDLVFQRVQLFIRF